MDLSLRPAARLAEPLSGARATEATVAEVGAGPKNRAHQHTMPSTHASLAARKGFSHASSRHPVPIARTSLSAHSFFLSGAQPGVSRITCQGIIPSSSSVRRKSLSVTLLTQRRDEGRRDPGLLRERRILVSLYESRNTMGGWAGACEYYTPKDERREHA